MKKGSEIQVFKNGLPLLVFSASLLMSLALVFRESGLQDGTYCMEEVVEIC